MKSTLKWLYNVPKKKKGYVIALTLIQAMTGGAGVLYALLLRNIVDSAVTRELVSFRQNVICLAALVLILIGVGAIVRWLHEQARADIENLFKKRLADMILRKDYAAISAVHSGEWMTRLTSDTSLVAGGYVDLLPGLVSTVIRLMSALIMIIALDRWFALILIPGGIDDAIARHQKVYDAIAAHDEGATMEAMSEHLRVSEQNVAQFNEKSKKRTR